MKTLQAFIENTITQQEGRAPSKKVVNRFAKELIRLYILQDADIKQAIKEMFEQEKKNMEWEIFN